MPPVGVGAAANTRSTIVALIAACAMFMENLDSTVISTALPAIAHSFGAKPVDLSLGITAYMMSLAVFIPISGWVADRHGGRRTFTAAIVVFTLGSALCGVAGDLRFFVLARIFQGMGGAMMVPVGRLMLIRLVDKSALVGAFAYLSLPPLLAPLLGAPLGGFIITFASWRWIFFMNLPIGLLGIVLALLYIPEFGERIRTRLDLLGFFLTSLSIVCVVLGLEFLARDDADYTLCLALLGGGAAVGAVAVVHARSIADPLVDFSLLRVPTFAACAVGGALFRVACGAMPFILPLMLQVGLGMSAFLSGLLTLSSGIGGLMMKSAAGHILRRFGFRNVLLGNGLIAAASLLLCAAIGPGMPVWLIALVLASGGFFRSLQFTALIAIAWADIPPSRASAATSLFGMLQQISFSGGIAFGALLLHAILASRGGVTPVSSDFAWSFIGIGGLALLNVASFLRLDRHAGAELSGHAAPAPAASATRPTDKVLRNPV